MAITDLTQRDPWGTLFKFAAIQQEVANRNFAKQQWMADIARETDNPEMFEAATGWKVPQAINPYYDEKIANAEERGLARTNPIQALMQAGESAADVPLPTSLGQRPGYVNNAIDYAGGASQAGIKGRSGKNIQSLGEKVAPGNVELLQKMSELTGLKPGMQGWDEAVSIAANKQIYAPGVVAAVERDKANVEKENQAIQSYNARLPEMKKRMGNKYLSDKEGGSAGWGADAKSIIENFNYAIKNFASSPQDVIKYYNLAESALKDAGVTWKRDKSPLGPLSGYMPTSTGGGRGEKEYQATTNSGKLYTFTTNADPNSKEFKEKMDSTGKNVYGREFNGVRGYTLAGRGSGDMVGGYKIDKDIQSQIDTAYKDWANADGVFKTKAAIKEKRDEILSRLARLGINAYNSNGKLVVVDSGGGEDISAGEK